jgi:hypothetical protein
MPKHSMTEQHQEAIFRRWLDAHLGLMLKIVRGCAAPQDQDDLFQDVLLSPRFAATLRRRPGFIAWRSTPRWRGDAGNNAGV